ncbi:hypothetical protein AVEN_169454-1, partial [Araneus ventricosus]
GLQWVWALCLLYGKTGLLGSTLLFKPLIVFYKPETVEALLNDPELIEKGSEYKLMVPWLGTGLITRSAVYVGLVHAKYESWTKRPPAGECGSLETGYQLRRHPRHLTAVQNYEFHPKIALELL